MRYVKYFRRYPAGNERCYVRALGILERMPPALIDRPRGKGDFLLMYFYDPVQIRVGGQLLRDRAGFLHIWPPGAWQQYGNPKASWQHSWLHCQGGAIAKFLSESALPVGRLLPLNQPALFERALASLYHELTSFRSEDTVLTRNLVHNLVRELARALRGPSEGGFIPARIQRVREHIEAQYARPVKIADLAALASLSPAHFSAEYRSHVGMAPMEHVIELRLLEASTLLANRNLTVTEVAAQVGYDDSYHFSKLFKKRFGASPRAYRGK